MSAILGSVLLILPAANTKAEMRAGDLPDDPGSLRHRVLPALAAADAHGPRSWIDGLVPSAEPAAPVASVRARLIQPGQLAPPLTARDKVAMGVDHAFSPLALAGWFASAGWGQLMNGYPKYGVDKGAFGMRLGSGALRDSTEAIFSDSLADPLLHEDPRYYRMGLSRGVGERVAYAASRPFVTRTDGGRRTVNLAVIAGTLAGAALTNTYYPANSRGARITFRTFGWSMEGSVIGDLVREFYGDMGDLMQARRERQRAP